MNIIQNKISSPMYSPFLFVLFMLVLVDMQFIGLHILLSSTNLLDSFEYAELLSIKKDRGFPEMYQYLKWQWLACMIALLAFKFRSFRYMSWSILFFYLLVDDALAIHERFGRLLASYWDFTPPYGVRLQDIGELAVSAGIGLVLMCLILLSIYKSGELFKSFSKFFALSFIGLVFFGVGVDTINGATEPGSTIKEVLVLIEDGGEMIVASIMLAGAYSFLRMNGGTKSIDR